MKVKKNDTVLVLTGKDAGKTGKVLSSIPADNKVKVDGINVQMRSRKARKQGETSAITPQVGAIDASNVMVVCPVCNKATRVAFAVIEGKKIRVCKKCGASLDTKAEAKKAAKKASKSTKKADADQAPKKTRKTTAKKADKAE
ncbi:MAG: 50S ribosomal protein L24 [Clostridia bacterium]|nr:50S ribosomal protein L24 [Clostridia bacterium]